jgi:hypothetical protein
MLPNNKHRAYEHQRCREKIWRNPQEVTLHNIVEPMRDQNVFHVGEHITDFVVPSLASPCRA